MIIFLVALGLFIYAAGGRSSKKNDVSADSIVELNAVASFDGIEFAITNNDQFAWVEVDLEINPGILTSGFTKRTNNLMPSQRIRIPASQFANSDGMRFDPLTYTAKTLKITCSTRSGRGLYICEWQ